MKTDDAAMVNPLCGKCLRRCKQSAATLLLECPRFLPMPFKVERHRFDQLSLFEEDPR